MEGGEPIVFLLVYDLPTFVQDALRCTETPSSLHPTSMRYSHRELVAYVHDRFESENMHCTNGIMVQEIKSVFLFFFTTHSVILPKLGFCPHTHGQKKVQILKVTRQPSEVWQQSNGINHTYVSNLNMLRHLWNQNVYTQPTGRYTSNPCPERFPFPTGR